jgi:2-polyprenyl-3-methyl-5-hydroxy-6-metoxy-1,4-benzoquinol methylase
LVQEGLTDRIFFAAPGKWNMWRCARCGSGWLDPRPTAATIGLAYQTYYTHETGGAPEPTSALGRLKARLGNGYRNRRYGTRLKPSLGAGAWLAAMIPPLRWSVDAAYRFLPAKPDGDRTLLDIGCGNGSFLEAARDAGWTGAGAEPDPEARRQAEGRGFEVRELATDWLSEPRRFRFVTLSHVIEHVHDPLALLRTAASLLAPGGEIFIDTPNVDAVGHSLYGPDWRGLEPPRHLVLFSRQSLADAISAAGFGAIQFHPRTDALPFTAVQSRRIASRLDPYSSEEPAAGIPLPSVRDKLKAIWGPTSEFLTVTARKIG